MDDFSEEEGTISRDSPLVVDLPAEDRDNQSDEFSEDDAYEESNTVVPKNGLRTGHRRVNMTPPHVLLLRSQKKAQRLRRDGQVDRSIKEYISCTALCRIVHGATHWKLSASYADLAEAYYELKGYTAQALYHSENAKTIMLSGLQTIGSSEDKADIYGVLVKIYYTMARAYIDMKKYAEAEQALYKARKSATEMNRLPSVNSTQENKMEIQLSLEFARLYTNQNKIAVAQTQYEVVAELTELVYGKDSPKLIPIYSKMADLEQRKGRGANKDRVLELYLQAHSVAAASYKSGSVEMVDTALGVADAYAYLERDDAEASAESYYNECLVVCTTKLGPQDERTILVQDHLARLYIATNRYQESLSLLRTNLRYKTERFGEYSEQVSDCHKLIGSIHLAQGHIDKCLQAYHKCHEIECLIFGSNHKKSKDTARNIDILKSSPSVAGRPAMMTKLDQLQNRPRFNTSCKLST